MENDDRDAVVIDGWIMILADAADRAERAACAIGRDARAGTWLPVVQSAIFLAGFVLSLVLLAYSVWRLVVWKDAIAARGAAGGVVTIGVTLLAATALISGCRWSGLFALSFAACMRHRRQAPPEMEHWPFVSIFVPCFNEGETIGAALESLLELDYPAYEIIVVNDGSNDETLLRTRQFAGQHGRSVAVRILNKPNGGKWSAHNLAFENSTGELVLCVDADSRLEPPALKHLVARMKDLRLSGVAGQMRVRNRVNLITRLQALEYLMGNGAGRMAQGFFDNVLVVPGPIGLFRRSVMEEVFLQYGRGNPSSRPGHVLGPFNGNTFAEDFDLSMAILCLGGRIAYEPLAVSHTKAPATHYALLNQRYRWIRGSIQVLRKLAQRARTEPRILSPRLIAWVGVTYLPELLLMPVIYWLGLGFFFVLLAQSGSPAGLAGWFAAFQFLQFCAGAFFVSLHNDSLSVLKVLPLNGIYNGFVLNSAWLIAVVDEIRGSRMHW